MALQFEMKGYQTTVRNHDRKTSGKITKNPSLRIQFNDKMLTWRECGPRLDTNNNKNVTTTII